MFGIHIDGLVQDCGNSSASAMELPQSCTKPYIYVYTYTDAYTHIYIYGLVQDCGNSIADALELPQSCN